MSLELSEVADVLKAHLPDATLHKVLKDLIAAEKAAKAAVAAEPTEPRPKQEMVVLIRGDASLRKAVEGGAWVIKQKEGTDTTTLLDRIQRSVSSHNDSLRGNRRASKLIRTFARAMDWLRPKAIDRVSGEFKVVTKTPVEVIVVESENVGYQHSTNSANAD